MALRLDPFTTVTEATLVKIISVEGVVFASNFPTETREEYTLEIYCRLGAEGRVRVWCDDGAIYRAFHNSMIKLTYKRYHPYPTMWMNNIPGRMQNHLRDAAIQAFGRSSWVWDRDIRPKDEYPSECEKTTIEGVYFGVNSSGEVIEASVAPYSFEVLKADKATMNYMPFWEAWVHTISTPGYSNNYDGFFDSARSITNGFINNHGGVWGGGCFDYGSG